MAAIIQPFMYNINFIFEILFSLIEKTFKFLFHFKAKKN